MSSPWLHVICGPMYSGKTDELLRLTRRLAITGYDIAVFKPEVDTRTAEVASRSGAAYEAHSVPHAQGIIDLGSGAQVVVVDEAQFFDHALVSAVQYLLNRGKHVIVAGLDRDFLGRVFGCMGELLVMADDVTKLTAVCFKCKGEASLTQRLVDGRPASPDDPLVVVGGMGDEKYEARCRSCWRLGSRDIGFEAGFDYKERKLRPVKVNDGVAHWTGTL